MSFRLCRERRGDAPLRYVRLNSIEKFRAPARVCSMNRTELPPPQTPPPIQEPPKEPLREPLPEELQPKPPPKPLPKPPPQRVVVQRIDDAGLSPNPAAAFFAVLCFFVLVGFAAEVALAVFRFI